MSDEKKVLAKEKINCPCGSKVMQKNMANHEGSQKHVDWLRSQGLVPLEDLEEEEEDEGPDLDKMASGKDSEGNDVFGKYALDQKLNIILSLLFSQTLGDDE